MSIPSLLECLSFMMKEGIIDTNFLIDKIFPCLTEKQLQELQNLCFLQQEEISNKINEGIQKRRKLTAGA